VRVPKTVSRAVMTPGFIAYKVSRRIRENPYRWFRLAQRFDPVHESALGVWILTSHSAIMAALRSPAIGRTPNADSPVLRSAILRRVFKQASPESRGASAVYEVFGNVGIFTDPVLQPRLQGFVGRAFTPRRIADIRAGIQEYVDFVLDEAAARGRFELVEEVARPLTTRVICRLMGVPESDEHVVAANAQWIVDAFDSTPFLTADRVERSNRAASALSEYVSHLVAERRRAPVDDMVSALLAADDNGRVPEHDQVVAISLMLLVVGQVTAVASIGNGVLALLSDPTQLAHWREDPSIEQSAVEEVLRYASPATVMVRDALDDIEIEGRHIKKGSLVAFILGAANRDPRVFPDPDRFDLTRQPNPHVSFGGGPHYCLGAPLARMELGVFFSSFVRRFPNARVAPDGVERLPSAMLRGLRRLEIVTDPSLNSAH
jgi:cytochrome P450